MINLDNQIKVIQKNDPDFPEHLDFEVLRREGLLHIGELSGKIWTDHNAHDPGVTILEVLCYALMDLGYRSQLSIPDLMAQDPSNSEQLEDNFLSPAQILSNNPVTILDFRKMLMDIPDIRNAWLEIGTEENVELYLDGTTGPDATEDCDLVCRSFPTEGNAADDDSNYKVVLNGLYKIYLELEQALNKTDNGELNEAEETRKNNIIETVKGRLNKHRNLCEDFIDEPCILEQDKIGVCGTIMLHETADPAQVYLAIIQNIRQFLSPKINYYTLKEMLEKGKSMEEIYEGRPYSSESFGFLDTDELIQIPRRTEIHHSDIYRLILNIEGVKSVHQLSLNKNANSTAEGEDWILKLSTDHLPVFSIENSHFNLYKGNIWLRFDQDQILQKEINTYKRVPLGTADLDAAIPQGTYRADLGDYYSIQNEFPLVYGIGEGGLSPDASDKRKAQALQLKGYLLFYDQLLSAYIKQLSHIRDIFSMRPDALRPDEAQRSYFTASLDSTPDLHQLIHTFPAGSHPLNGTVMAHPVDAHILEQLAILEQNPNLELAANTAQFEGLHQQKLAISQWQRIFRQGDFKTHLGEESCGHFFILESSMTSTVLLSQDRYPSRQAAQAAIESVAFLGTLAQVYRAITAKEEPFNYTFELVFSDYDYYNFLQNLVENKDQYCKRRNAFLDHLLARFSENFTDYAVLLYGTNEASTASKNAKARFLSNYPELSHNRSKAFNYQDCDWVSDNVSGLEKRLKAIADMPTWGRQSLCNFDVIKLGQEFIYQLNDVKQNLHLHSIEKYDTKDQAENAVQSLKAAMKHLENYKKEDAAAAHTYRFSVVHDLGTATHPTTYATAAERDIVVKDTYDLFREQVLDEDIFVSRHEYSLGLFDNKNEPFGDAIQAYPDTESAEAAIDIFIKNINENHPIELVMIENDPTQYLNIRELKQQVAVHTVRYRWQLRDDNGNQVIHSFLDFEDTAAAATDFAKMISTAPDLLIVEQQDANLFINSQALILATTTFETAEQAATAKTNLENILAEITQQQALIHHIPNVWSWSIAKPDGAVLMKSHYYFRIKRLAEIDWREASTGSQNVNNLVAVHQEEGQFIIHLKNEAGQIIAQSPIFTGDPNEKIADIQETFKLKKNANFVKKDQGFAYQIAGQNNQILLVSHQLYSTASLALQARNKMLGQGFSRGNFLPSGDGLLRNYSFYLQDATQTTLAFHPAIYSSLEEREAALHLSLAALNNYQSPLHYIEEYTAFFKNKEQEEWLTAVQTFSTADAAQEDFIKHLSLFAQAQRFQLFETPEQAFIFGLNGETQLFATAKATFENETSTKEAINEVLSTFKNATYQIQITKYESHWRFRFLTNRSEETPFPWFESTKEFTSPDEAKAAWMDMIQQPFNIEVSIQNEDNGMFTFALSQSDNETIIAKHPRSFETQEAVLPIHNQAIYLYGYVVNMHSTADPTYDYTRVHKSEDSQRGDFVFRLFKKDSPLAYHPGCCKKEAADLKDCMDVLTTENINYLRISWGEDKVVQVEDKYHFVIRNLENSQVLFTSYQSFEDKETAHACFGEQYLTILQVAAKSTHYFQKEGDDSTWYIYEKIKFSDEIYKSVGEPIATIKSSDFEDFNLVNITTIARSYPIRCTIKDEGNSCKNEDISIEKQYCFQIWSADKILWKSAVCYDTVGEAEKDFKLFLSLLQNQINYAPYFDASGQLISPEKVTTYNEELAESDEYQEPLFLSDCLCEEDFGESCCYYLSITEPLLLSQRFGQRKDAWGYQAPNLDLTCEEQSTFPKPAATGLPLFLETAQEDTAFYPFRDEMRGYAHCFHVVEKDYRVGQYKQVFNTSGERNTALIELFEAYKNNPDIEQIRKDWNFNANYKEEDILDLLKIQSNYQGILKQHCGLFAIELVNPAHILATNPRCYDTLAELENAIERTKACVNNEGMHLVEHILLRPTTCTSLTTNEGEQETELCLLPAHAECACELYFENPTTEDCPPETTEIPASVCATDLGDLTPNNEGLEKYIPGADPYSFWATIVLPSWTKRFRQANFRDFFFQLLYHQAPVHIAFNVVWISPWQMCEFEKIYKKWLQNLSGKTACAEDLSDLSCQLLNCILALQNCPADEVPIEAPATSPCITNDDIQSNETIHPSVQMHCLFSGKTKPFPEEVEEDEEPPNVIDPTGDEIIVTDEPIGDGLEGFILTDVDTTSSPENKSIAPKTVTNKSIKNPSEELVSSDKIEVIKSPNTSKKPTVIHEESVVWGMSKTDEPVKRTTTTDEPVVWGAASISETRTAEPTPTIHEDLDFSELMAIAAGIVRATPTFLVEKKQEASELASEEVAQKIVIDTTTDTPTKSKENASSTSLSKAEIAQHIRQREATYIKNIEAIPDSKIRKSASYKRTAFFLSTDGNFREYQELVKHIIRYSLHRKGGVSDVHYFTLLYNATGYYLDQQIEQHPTTIPHEEDFTALFNLMLEKGLNQKQLKKIWKATALKKWLKAAVINKYLKMMK